MLTGGAEDPPQVGRHLGYLVRSGTGGGAHIVTVWSIIVNIHENNDRLDCRQDRLQASQGTQTKYSTTRGYQPGSETLLINTKGI